jgi:hypothetical protein
VVRIVEGVQVLDEQIAPVPHVCWRRADEAAHLGQRCIGGLAALQTVPGATLDWHVDRVNLHVTFKLKCDSNRTRAIN